MENAEVINLWKSYNQKLEENLMLNRRNAEDITKLKVQSFLSTMKPLKIFIVLMGIGWVVFLDVFIVHLYAVVNPFFLVSAIVIALLNKLAIVLYIYQIVVIHQVDISEPILKTQEKLARLKSSTLWVTRLLFLQLPFWTTFHLNKIVLENGNIWFFSIQLLITMLLLFLAIWLFFNIKYENKDKKWFRYLFNDLEWTPIIKSIELCREIEAFKQEETQL